MNLYFWKMMENHYFAFIVLYLNHLIHIVILLMMISLIKHTKKKKVKKEKNNVILNIYAKLTIYCSFSIYNYKINIKIIKLISFT